MEKLLFKSSGMMPVAVLPVLNALPDMDLPFRIFLEPGLVFQRVFLQIRIDEDVNKESKISTSCSQHPG
jgi:hypothetical protein